MKSLFVGIEIGGTKLQAGIGTSEGKILHMITGSVPPEPTAETILSWFEPAMHELNEWAGSNEAVIDGIGIGFGGPVNSKTGRTLKSHQVDGWDEFPILDWFETRYSMPVVVENDANAAGWGEFKCGAGKGTNTFCYMNIGSGIGGALIINDTLHNGQGSGAFEVGHTRVPDPQSPGTYSKLEDLCSGWAIEEHLQRTVLAHKKGYLWDKCEGNVDNIRCEWLTDAILQSDPTASKALDSLTKLLGFAVSNAITLIHPEIVAIGGGVSLLGDVLLEPLRTKIDEMVFEPYKNRYKIQLAELSETVVIVGSILLAAENSTKLDIN